MINVELMVNFNTLWLNDFVVFNRFGKWVVNQHNKGIKKFDFLEQAIQYCVEN